MLNDPTFVEASRAFASRVLAEAEESTDARLDFLFETALSRTPDETERTVLTDLLSNNWSHFEQDPDAAERLLGVGLTARNETTDPVELAAWTTVARAVLNLNETITRN